MSENFIGQIRMFAGNFAPRDNAFCDGQLISIAQNTALFAVIGTTFGGNGQTNFGLPDLQGRTPLGYGTGRGLTPRELGEVIGEPTVTLLAGELPIHNHGLAAAASATGTAAAGGYWGVTQPAGRGATPLIYGDAPTTTFNGAALGGTGGSGPHPNQQPYQVIPFVIALQGVFPPRN